MIFYPFKGRRRAREPVGLSFHVSDDGPPFVHRELSQIWERPGLVVDPFPKLRVESHGRPIPSGRIFLMAELVQGVADGVCGIIMRPMASSLPAMQDHATTERDTGNGGTP